MSTEREWVELSHPIDDDTARMPFLPAPSTEPVEEAFLRATDVTLATHVGTHVEAPRHRFSDGKTIDEYPPERWITNGVVVDAEVEGREPIGPDRLEPPVPLEPGDALLIRTGWEERVGDDSYAEPPYLTEEAAEWIVERELGWIGVDSPTPEVPGSLNPDATDYPVHTALLGNDVLVAENVTNLGGLVGRAVEVIALPLRLVGVEAAQARIVARPR